MKQGWNIAIVQELNSPDILVLTLAVLLPLDSNSIQISDLAYTTICYVVFDLCLCIAGK